jgi:hypothetical protein
MLSAISLYIRLRMIFAKYLCLINCLRKYLFDEKVDLYGERLLDLFLNVAFGMAVRTFKFTFLNDT